MFLSFLQLGLNYRMATLFVLALVTAITGAGLKHLTVDTGVDSLIPGSDPDRLAYERVSDEFGTDNRTVVYVRDEKLWTAGKLLELEKLHNRIERLDGVEKVDDLFTLRSIVEVDKKIDSRLLLESAPATDSDAEDARLNAMSNPLVAGNFLSSDGNTTALIVSVRENPDDDQFNQDFNRRLEEALVPARESFSTVFQVGAPRINTELQQSLFEDFRLLGPLSALILVVAILAFLRSGFAAFAPLVTSAITIVWTFGMMGWVGIPLNILSVMIPSLIIVIGSTEDTHMMASYFHSVTGSGSHSREEATRYMLKRMGLPLMLTIMTTSLGFAGNIFSNIGLIQDFAIASTFALLTNGLVTILLLPILLARYGPRENPLFHDSDHVGGLPGMVLQAFRLSSSHIPRLILVITGVLCVFFVYQAAHLYVTNDPLSYFPDSRPLIQDVNTIHDDLSGIKTFFITLESEQTKAFQEPGNLKKLAAIQQFMDKQGIFDRSISIADYLAYVNREFRQGSSREFLLPESRELVAQYLLFFHRSDLEGYVSHDYRRANIVVRHNVSDSHTLNQYIDELREVSRYLAGADMRVYIVGQNLMVNSAAEALMVGQVKSLVILLIVIFLVMSAMFTSFKGGLVALIPASIPIVLMFGIMGLLGIPLNPGTAMVAVIAIGIAIDGTIHLFSRYNELCRRTTDYSVAIDQTVREEATPLVASSLSLSLGFGILLLSNFTVVAQFGALAALTMLFSIYANLLITPIIMSHVRLVGLHQILGVGVQIEVLENSPLFKNMTNYQIRKAVLISEVREYAEGDLIIEQDTYGRSMYLILSGEAEVIRRNEGESIKLATLTPGQVLGEIGYIRETRRTADVRAATPVSVLRFDYEKLETDLKYFPRIVSKLNSNISSILGERLAEVVERMHKESEESRDTESRESRDTDEL